jgi:probable phosphoglycerate mutase
MTTLLLIRHGETEWNVEGRIQGFSDSPLTDAGHAQAKALAGRLTAERLDALVSSDLGRTRRTTAPIAQATGLAPVFDSALRERNYGAWEGRTYLEVKRDHPGMYARFMKHDPKVAPKNGETAVEFSARVVSALTRIASRGRGKRIAVVAHGGVLGIMYRHAMGLALDAPRTYTIENASINRLSFEGRRWKLESWGEVGHLAAPSLDDLD